MRAGSRHGSDHATKPWAITGNEGVMMNIPQALALLVLGSLMGSPVTGTAERETGNPQAKVVRPEVVADFIHAVIEADRTVYTTHVVDRMQETGTVLASENWESRNALPLPAQLLLLAGIRVKKAGIGLEYRLASLLPIYQKNGPATDFEKNGLAAIDRDPSQPYTGYVSRGERTYFQAIYADRAVSRACVNCHNTHLLSPKRDRKLGEVMGGVIISFPVE
jgi:hypothetical protein